MEGSLRAAGCMAVFAASGGVILLALKVHKHLMSDFMHKIEHQFEMMKDENKRVKFSNEVDVLPYHGIDDRHQKMKQYVSISTGLTKGAIDDEKRFRSMPENWQALYRGIAQFRALKKHNA
ncbi:hypothetical protein DM860_003965 [Cuscuta australis]|uniref:Uncharacterized protein n=1 Tax=Cuscuta australis TaxID=267555 RepID=A0A328CZH7_9ASTE|nr:hypothetical protein DM860_003965 [Cuscuta australis]